MRYLRYIGIELKVILLRIPIVLFFSILFPLMMMVIVVGSVGNIEIGDGYHLSDKYIMIASGIGLIPLCLVSLPVSITAERESGVMERYLLFGINPFAILGSKVVVHMMIAIIQFVLVCVFAKIVYSLNIPGGFAFISFILHYLLAAIFTLSLGVLLGLLTERVQIVQVAGLALMFSILALSGGFNEFNTLPEGVQNAMNYFPVKYLMNDFINIWFTTDLFLVDFVRLTLIYLVVIGVLSYLLMRRTFKFHYSFQLLGKIDK